MVAMAFISMKSYAQDLVFNMTEDSGVEIVKTGSFDVINNCVGNTDGGTTIRLGEVDFADGNKYAGVSVLQAQEQGGMEGYIDIFLGDPDNGGKLINDLLCKGTGGWQYYKTYAYNFYPEGSDVTRPTGKGTVYVRYRQGEEGEKYYCNLKRVTFYTQELSEEQMGLQGAPVYNYEEYFVGDDITIIDQNGTDAHIGDDGQIGWTGTGVVAAIYDAEFKDGQFKQVAVNMTHQGTSVNCRILVYVDEIADDNLIASIWTGRDFSVSWSIYDFVADDMKKTVSGKHDIFLVWNEPSNIKSLRLCEGNPYEVEYGHKWVEGKEEEPVEPEVVLSENAYIMTFDGMGGVENNTEIVAAGSAGARYESANIGYTSTGVCVRFDDVDFRNGEFDRIVVESSTDQSALSSKSAFEFYIDLPYEMDFSDMSLYKDYDMIASVKAPATGGWGNKKLTAGDINGKVTGLHDLYMLWNVSNGCNVHRVALDMSEASGINEVKVNANSDAVYNVAGQRVSENYKGIVIKNGAKYLK